MIITDASAPASDKQPPHWGINALRSLLRIAGANKTKQDKNIPTAEAIVGTTTHREGEGGQRRVEGCFHAG